MEWVSVKDRLPEYPFLIYYNNRFDGNAAVAFYDSSIEKWVLFHSQTEDKPIKTPDFWMPLPEPPKSC